jgi:endonuclease/exonuclease/phosphatase family metal-dependent hydrolase
MRLLPLIVGLLATTACSSGVASRLGGAGPAPDAPAPVALSTGETVIDISVLIYNVEGLPWPARRGRGRALDDIGAALARLRAAGAAPDIIMVQEAFTRRGAAIGVAADYPFVAAGPRASDRRSAAGADIPRDFAKARRFLKGERFPKVLNGGLYIFSKFPIRRAASDPFSARACAGFDCLSNKGALLASVDIPGAPTPVDFLTTHMNAQGASRVDLDRTHVAHRLQTDEIAKFLTAHRGEDHPLIFGGDFNMRNASNRLEHFTYRKPYHIVRHYCTVAVDDCDVRMSWDGDAPWLDTQDLQGFDDGALVTLRPARVEAMFDGPETGGKLSDHDGYLVTYRLSWPSSSSAAAPR